MSMKKDLLKIDKIHTYVRGKAFEEEIDMSLIKIKLFKSFDLKFLERQINEFLDEHIYVKHICRPFKCNTDEYWQISNKSTLHIYKTVVYYVEYPF